MKFLKCILGLFKKFAMWIYKNILLLVSLASLIAAFSSVFLAKYSLENSISQNKINSRKSDSLFKIQLISSKRLNDSIINEFNKLRHITDNQLSITQSQLLELKIQSKPRIALTKFWINYSSNDNITSEYYMQLNLLNVGNREAFKVSYKSTVIKSDFSKILDFHTGSITNSLNSSEEYPFNFSSKIPYQNSNILYVYLCIYFFDSELNELQSHEYFYKYNNAESSELFTSKCNIKEINVLKKIIIKEKKFPTTPSVYNIK